VPYVPPFAGGKRCRREDFLMRLVLTAILSLAVLPAYAQSSVGSWQSDTAGQSSIQVITCQVCPPVVESERDRLVRTFPGGMTTETRDVYGEQKIVRTDNMWGGSPVTTVTSTTLALGAPFASDSDFAEPADGTITIDEAARPMRGEAVSSSVVIDHAARTSAVADLPSAGPADFELRLN
jgi:hypothetical protein